MPLAIRKILATLVLSVALLPVAAHPQTKSSDEWKPLAWLIGDWAGSGSGPPGQGAGSFSFQPDLQGKILIRKSFAEYPATVDKAAYRHDDLMVIFREGESFKAIYFDNEGHVIRYTINVSADAAKAVFTSDGATGAPSFRLTYEKTSETALAGKFEIAPPDRPFSTYLEWTARKQPAK